MAFLHFLTKLFVIVGALNWGLVGFFNYNPINDYLGMGWARVIYAVVGIAGLLSILCLCKCCKSCGGGGSGSCGSGSCGCGKSGCNCGSKGQRPQY
jgi:uncharacterized membrane protein YuzA (DUF378 family)